MKRLFPENTYARLAWLGGLAGLLALSELAQAAAPANDAFANRFVVSGFQFVAMATNTYATAESGEPAHAGQIARRSLWWSWLAPCDGTAQLSVTNPGPPSMRSAVYVGNVLTNLTVVASNASSAIKMYEFPARGGETYQIAADIRLLVVPSFTLSLNLAALFLAQPAAEARLTAGRAVTLSVTNTETEPALMRVDYFVSSNWVGCATAAPFTFDWTPSALGRTQLSAVATNSLGGRRESPAVWVTVVPPNDHFTNALAIQPDAFSAVLTGSNALANAEVGEPAHAGQAATNSLWWRWTPARSGYASLKITSAATQPRMAVYAGDALSNLVAVASATASSAPVELAFEAVAGTTYLIAVDGTFSGAGGVVTAELSITPLRFLSPPPGTRVLVNHPVEIVVTNYDLVRPFATLELMVNTSNTVASDWSPPWTLTWTTNQLGDYTSTARGTNSAGELWGAGAITLRVSPANDDFTNAFELPSLPNAVASAESTTAFATHEAGELIHQTTNAAGSVWFTWVAPWSGDISFSTEGSLSSPILVVYQGSRLDNLVPLTASGSVVASVVQGQRYYLAADAVPGSEGHVRVSVFPPPVNNGFANAIELTGTTGSYSGSNVSANHEPGEPPSWGPGLPTSIWWRWTAPANGDFTFNTAGSLAMTVEAAVYTGTTVSSLTTILVPTISSSLSGTGDGIWSSMTFRVRSGVTYYLRFSGTASTQDGPCLGLYGTIAGTYSFHESPDVLANDHFAGRLPLPEPGNVVVADNSLATSESGEPHPATCNPTGRTLWWTYTAPGAGMLRVSAAVVTNGVVWTLYRGTALDQLQLLGSSCSQPLTNTVLAGEEYVICVDGAYGRAGAFTLKALLFPAPPNDCFTNSVRLEGTNVTFTGNLTAATPETGEPQSGSSHTVWVSWAAPCLGRVRFMVTGAAAPYARAYTGSSLDSLQPVAVIDVGYGNLGFLAEEGMVYHFQISGGADTFTFDLSENPLNPATNDDLADARVIKGHGNSLDPESVLGATMEAGEPAHLGAVPQKSIWWKWQAPTHGTTYISSGGSLVTNVTLAAYTGPALEALTLVGRAVGTLQFPMTAGETYYIAAAVPDTAVGDVVLYARLSILWSNPSIPVPGNLLQEWSWEGTAILNAQYWGRSGSIGGYVNERGGADGTTWPNLSSGTEIWQDVATVPGRNHSVRFAMGGAAGPIRVTWDDREIGLATFPEGEIGYWHWQEFAVVASNTTSRVKFKNLGGNVDMDAFSVVPLTAPPEIINEPVSASVMTGGTAAFTVGVKGTLPLAYQWYFNGAPLTVRTNGLLVLETVTTNQAGTYQAVITNLFGAVTSAVAMLAVDAPIKPVILWQPYGDTVNAGGYFNFSVVASGAEPLSYQWFKDGNALAAATNRNLALSPVSLADAGMYSVRVASSAGIVWSLDARLVVSDAAAGGGVVRFRNVYFGTGTNLTTRVFDLDGVTPLSGSNFMAQLYAGPSLEWLRPAGQPSFFRSGYDAGSYYSQLITLSTVPPGAPAVVQVRAWDARKGTSYEEARAMGGKFGKSDLLTLTAGGGSLPPAELDHLAGFSLRAGMPQFTSGLITFLEREPGGTIIWSHRGEPGFRYLMEKSEQGFEWRPYLVITNLTSTATFTDADAGSASATFYRSRILD